MTDDPPPAALDYRKALWGNAPDALRAEYIVVGGKLGDTPQHPDWEFPLSPPDRWEVKPAWEAITDNFKNRLRTGELVLYGRPGDVFADWCQISAREAPELEFRGNPDHAFVLGIQDTGRYWWGVHCCRREDLEQHQGEPGMDDETEDGGDQEWSRGLTPSDWAARHHPEVFEILKENYGASVVVALDGFDDSTSRTRCFTARESLCSNLMADVEAGRVVLKIPPSDPAENAKVVSYDAIIEVIEGLTFYSGRSHQSYFKKTWVEIRIFRGDKMPKDVEGARPPSESAADGETNDGREPPPLDNEAWDPKKPYLHDPAKRKCYAFFIKEFETQMTPMRPKPVILAEAKKATGLPDRALNAVWERATEGYPIRRAPGRKKGNN